MDFCNGLKLGSIYLDKYKRCGEFGGTQYISKQGDEDYFALVEYIEENKSLCVLSVEKLNYVGSLTSDLITGFDGLFGVEKLVFLDVEEPNTINCLENLVLESDVCGDFSLVDLDKTKSPFFNSYKNFGFDNVIINLNGSSGLINCNLIGTKK